MEKISVSIRVRPIDKQEAAKSLWKINSNAITLCNASGAPSTNQVFVFDHVFGSESTTSDIYKATTEDIVASAVKGFNGTVFAYGQTSSGKTFTMRGTRDTPGIIPLAILDVFKNLEEAVEREFLLRMSYMEIYNEDIRDLLAPEQTKLQVHESLERGIFVAGLREEIVANPEQVLQLMEFGEAHRHVGETNMNVHSSRSHSIFRMVIESRDKSQDDSIGFSCDAVRVSVLNLVDLAGSERVAKTGAEGARLKEGTHINKSLMVLGTVINKLSEGVQNQGGHVPYRDSKLTRILQPALGGNARTAIICNITPALVHVDESRGTLQFASRAIRVTNCAQVNEILTDAALLKRQKKEIEELRAKLKESHSEHLEDEILTLRNTLLKSECERERIALELQEEKKAHAERERMQAQKIENLSTLVLNSAVEDRDFEKRSRKNARRETWCPRITSGGILDKDANEIGQADRWLPQNRDMLSSMPPPFESLLEEEETSNDIELGERQGASPHQQRCTISVKDVDSDCFSLPDRNARIHVADRKRKHFSERNSVRDDIEALPQGSEADKWNRMESDSSNFEDSRSHQSHRTEKLDTESTLEDKRTSVSPIQSQSTDLIIKQLSKELVEAKDEAASFKLQLNSALIELQQLKIEGQRNDNDCNEELKALLDSLRKENEELGAQLTEVYIQFEEEKAAWVAAQKPSEEGRRDFSMFDGLNNAEQAKNVSNLDLLKSRLQELQQEVDTANKVAEQAANEREGKALEIVAMQSRINEMHAESLQERSLRETTCKDLEKLKEELSSTQDLLSLCKAESEKERWMLKSEVLKLQVCLDAVTAKSEVFHGRLLEVRDELKDTYEELDCLKGLKKKQNNEALCPAEAVKTEVQKMSMSDAVHDRLEKDRGDEGDAAGVTCSTDNQNTKEELSTRNSRGRKSLCLEKMKVQPLEKETTGYFANGLQTRSMDEITRFTNENLVPTVCISVRNAAAKHQELPIGAAQEQSRRPHVSALAVNIAAGNRATTGVAAVSKNVVPGADSHLVGLKPLKPMPRGNTVRSKSNPVNRRG